MIEKMKMTSDDLVLGNIEYIARKFPNVVVKTTINGKEELSIDFELLKQELSSNLLDAKNEGYRLTWPGKRNSILVANSPTKRTLRPILEKSVSFDSSSNIYIEGDNLDALKILRETYLGKVKVIYIDPPYNTGKDRIYKDSFEGNVGDYLNKSDNFDNHQNRVVTNLETNGRFHSDWLDIMYPRMKLAKDFLSEDGILFISISNKELANLILIGNEIFGEENFLGLICWESKTKCQNTETAKRQLQNKQEYILVYKKKPGRYEFLLETIGARTYDQIDLIGPYRKEQIGEMSANGIRARSTMIFPILGVLPKSGNQWKYGKETINEFMERGDIIKEGNKVFFKLRPSDEEDKQNPFWSFYSKEIGTAETAKTELENEIGEHPFDTVKPVSLIKDLIFHVSENDDIIMDFFSGSGTTGKAVFELNQADGKKRSWILVQIPDDISNDPIAAKKGYKTICDIAEKRLQISCEATKSGMRVFRVDSSNMRDVFYSPIKLQQSLLSEDIDNVKPDRSPLDLLFQVMLDLGVELSAKIEEKEIFDKRVFSVNENFLVACFSDEVSDDLVKEMAKLKPVYAVFKDSGFINDAANLNCEQLFKTISPSTELRVL